jgi:[acyl-carrier-protein] S-malonyltransferase
MSKSIVLFPGQGSQFIGMGKALFDSVPSAKLLLEEADDTLGFSLSSLMLEGPENKLKQTQNTQPALYTAGMMAWSMYAEDGLNPDYVAGHSLGEYTAIAAAGGLSFAEGLKLVRLRGELMASAGEKSPGAMSAILGMDEADLANVLESAQSAGVVVAANFNCPGQIVISGSVAGVNKAGELAADLGKKVVSLPVSGAFHSPLMEFARAGLAEGIQNAKIKDLEIPLIANVSAEVVRDSETIAKLLVEQLTGSVQWTRSMQQAVSLGITKGAELGAGKVLMGLTRKISREIKISPIDSPEALAKFKGV